MRMITIAVLLMLGVVLVGCSGVGVKSLQCVPYARKHSGIEIYGDAHTWWHKALPQYTRGGKPESGAVLVLAKTSRLPYGHVAVVERIIGSREMEVAHANWGKDALGRGRIYSAMLARDVSKNNDWSQIAFFMPDADAFTEPYLAKGFIYKRKS